MAQNLHLLAQIKKIYSKAIVFGQCRKWLAMNLNSAQLVDCISTAKAAQIAAKEKHAAVIGNKILDGSVRKRFEDLKHKLLAVNVG